MVEVKANSKLPVFTHTNKDSLQLNSFVFIELSRVVSTLSSTLVGSTNTLCAAYPCFILAFFF